MSISPHVEVLIESAANARLAVLYCRKGATAEYSAPRLEEPYSFAQGKQDLMVRCFQLEHDGDTDESGWRFFMSHKIQHAEPISIAFKPRRKVVLPTGEVTHVYEPDPNWKMKGRQQYRDLICNALADGRVDPREFANLQAIKKELGLDQDDIRYVHAALYHRCLGYIIEDGVVQEPEVEQIAFVHETMRKLGWAVGETTDEL